MRFDDKLAAAWRSSGAMLCVGLDPDPERISDELRRERAPVFAFNRRVIDAVGDLVCAFKPQAAHHAALGAEADLVETIRYIRSAAPHAVVILDAKRGDIGSTAEMYAREAFERYDADAVTVNPFLGEDTLQPFFERRERGVFVLCRTSNPGAGWIQSLAVDGEPLFAAIARRAQTAWNRAGNVGLVVGATAPAELARIRAAAPHLPILAPGVGEQGGSPEAVVQAGARGDGAGLLVSASRSVIFAESPEAIRAAAQELHGRLRVARPGDGVEASHARTPGVADAVASTSLRLADGPR